MCLVDLAMPPLHHFHDYVGANRSPDATASAAKPLALQSRLTPGSWTPGLRLRAAIPLHDADVRRCHRLLQEIARVRKNSLARGVIQGFDFSPPANQHLLPPRRSHTFRIRASLYVALHPLQGGTATARRRPPLANLLSGMPRPVSRNPCMTRGVRVTPTTSPGD